MAISALALAAAALATAGCGGSTSDKPAPAAAPASSVPAASPAAAASPSAAVSPAAPPVVPERLKFTGKTVDGRAFDAASLAGKPVVLWFWAPWCPTCMQQAPGVRETAAKYNGKVAVVGVAGLDKVAAMKTFITEENVGSVPHLADEPGTIWKKFGVTAQSEYVLLDRAGTVTFKGYLDNAGLAKRVAALAS